jgi:pSer/pThr/pTyr-binding forkhead associated (FHA) protein
VARQRLVINSDDKGRFCLSVDGGVLMIGDNAQEAEVILRNLRVAHIYCEVEVEDKVVVVNGIKAALGQPPLCKELHPGEGVRVGLREIRLEAGVDAPAPVAKSDVSPSSAAASRSEPLSAPAAGTPPATAPAVAPVTEAGGARLFKQLVVIDGGDHGRVFALPNNGVYTIGKTSRHANIVLHDLYVARIHCELHIQGDSVRVVHREGQNGTLIDGQRITDQLLPVGSVLRVGNSHLRLDTVVGVEAPAAQSKKDAQLQVQAEEPAEEVIVEDVAEAGGAEIIEEDVEIVEDIVEAVNTAPAAAAATEQGEVYALPHSPIDELLKIEDQMLGHFKVECLLGRGQSGLVFRARDLHNNQVVTLKVLSPDFPADDEELHQFIGALKALPHLTHANLVTLYRAGRTGPHCWIAREYIDGEGLARVISRLQTGGAADWTWACRTILDLGKALRFLHEHKVTHGNITPRNILVGKSRVTKLADLMLGRALLGSRLQNVILPKKLLAEAVFLAPEQTLPQGSVDPRTDIYALGVIAYTMLTGQPPFAGSSLREITAQIREAPVTKPSKQQPGIPLLFEAVVLKMMARRREDRFQSAAEVMSYVEPLAEEHGIAV